MTLVEYPVKNVYIWESSGWTWAPWANTLAYYPLKTDWNEASWKTWLNIVNNWIKFNWVAIFDWNNHNCHFENDVGQAKTISMRINRIWWWNDWYCKILDRRYTYQYITVWSRYSWNVYTVQSGNLAVLPSSQRTYFVFIIDDQIKLYLNWELAGSGNKGNLNWTWYYIWGDNSSSSRYNYDFIWMMSELIFEDRVRTAQEIADYYNATKWNY